MKFYKLGTGWALHLWHMRIPRWGHHYKFALVKHHEWVYVVYEGKKKRKLITLWDNRF